MTGPERANDQLFQTELTAALDLPTPEPAEADAGRIAYCFERRVAFCHGDGSESYGDIDLYRRGALVLEATAQTIRHDRGIMATTDVLADTLITGELLAQLPDLGPCELVEGRIVRTRPAGRRHGRIEGRVYGLLDRFLEAHPLGELFVGEVGIHAKRLPDTVRGADIAFVSHDRLTQQDSGASFFTVAPDIVIEILSPSNRAEEVETKVQECLAAGSLEVWVVYAERGSLSHDRKSPSARRRPASERAHKGNRLANEWSLPTSEGGKAGRGSPTGG